MAIDERVERLERELTRAKRRCYCLLTVFGLVVGICALLSTAQSQEAKKVIRANEFVLEDENGKTRAVLGVSEDEPRLALFDKNGKVCAVLSVGMEAKLVALERKVSSVEESVRTLTAKPSKPTPAQTVEKGKWKVLANWRTGLRKGMTKDDVRALLGEPDKVDVYSLIGEVWHYGYPTGGTVNFSTEGAVESWSEPPPDVMK